MRLKLLLVLMLIVVLLLPASAKIKTVDMGSYTVRFDTPFGMRHDEHLDAIATEIDTVYRYAFWNDERSSKLGVIYLTDNVIPCTPEWINDTLDFWLNQGTVRVKTWNVSTEDIIAYRGEGVTKLRAQKSYGFARAFNVTQGKNESREDIQLVNMFIVIKITGVAKEEADKLFGSMEVG